MRVINGAQLANGLLQINVTLKATIKQVSSVLSKLLSIKNTESSAVKQPANSLFHPQRPASHPSLSILPAFKLSSALISETTSVIKIGQLNAQITETICRSNEKKGPTRKRQAPRPPSDAEVKHKPRAFQLRPIMVAKNPIASSPTKKRRAPLPPLTPELISRLEQTIKSTPQPIQFTGQRPPPSRPLQPSGAAKLKLALKDFRLNPEMAREKWGLLQESISEDI